MEGVAERVRNLVNHIQEIQQMVKSGVIQRIFAALQQEQIIAIHVEVLAIDNTSKVHLDGHGALKKSESSQSENQKTAETPSFMWYPQMIRSSLRCTSPEDSAKTDRKDECRLKR